MEKIKLKNGAVYEIEPNATPNNFTIICDTLTARDLLETLSEENLSEIHFLSEKGAVTGKYKNKLLCSYTDNGNAFNVNIDDADLCRYGLVIDGSNRIISAPLQRYAPAGVEIVDELPDGNIMDYLRVNGEYVFAPLPEPEQNGKTLENRVETLETSNAELTEAVDMILSGVTSDE